MFFVAAKVAGFLIQPLNLIALFLAAGIVALLAHRRRAALAFSGAALALLGLATWTNLGAVLLQPLENRFHRPASPPPTVAGIVVLGGFFEGGVNLARGGYELNNSADRIVEAAALAHAYPEARIVVTGGSGALVLKGEGDADTAPRLLQALGIARDRLVLENQSRDTYENALFTRRMVDPKPGETWLLVTSAFHMPRAMALFRKAGFAVVAWPADYRTAGDERFGPARDNTQDSLQNLGLAIREWVGLAAYRLAGRTDALFPAPD